MEKLIYNDSATGLFRHKKFSEYMSKLEAEVVFDSIKETDFGTKIFHLDKYGLTLKYNLTANGRKYKYYSERRAFITLFGNEKNIEKTECKILEETKKRREKRKKHEKRV